MRNWDKLAGSWVRTMALGAMVAGVGIVGCGQKVAVNEQPGKQEGGNKEATPVAKANPSTPSTPETPGKKETPDAPAEKDFLHQSFVDATRNADNPPADEKQPPDLTIASKPTFQLLKDLQKSWDSIRFYDSKKVAINYTAVVETGLGTFEIELKPEFAPNHVRNFIALSRLGYYDSLLVDRIHHEVSQVSTDAPALKLDMIEMGCPMGTGEVPSGSIGYWLRPEFNDKVKHEEGTVGFCRGSEPDSASTRFYVTLDQAPLLDGNFTIVGKVKSGLDVVRKIARQPVIIDDADQSGSHRPESQILIRKVTIKTDAAETK